MIYYVVYDKNGNCAGVFTNETAAVEYACIIDGDMATTDVFPEECEGCDVL